MAHTACFAFTYFLAEDVNPAFLTDDELFADWVEFCEGEHKHKPDAMVVGLERTQEGRWHLQGCLHYNKSKNCSASMNAVMPACNVRKAKGTWKQNKLYCMKGLQSHDEWTAQKAGGPNYGKEARTLLWGVEPVRGQQTTYAEVMDDFKDGKMTLDELVWNHPMVFGRFRNAFLAVNAVRQKRVTNTFREVQCHIFWGAAGSGKTRRAYEETQAFAPGSYLYSISCGDGHNLWFDGYDGEGCALIDDFYGQISFAFWLRLMDRYPIKLQIKGGYTYANWTRIYITSNKCPCQWWPNLAERPWDKEEFRRRITSITAMGGVEPCSHDPPVRHSHDRE